ncbi:hypothetical protein JCM24511_08001 [Saitozyma sp. JCM 24511]|nr:hypothetical protein JCM24511_08001 [Saitozyma sp. JCM 24511]
MEANTEDKFDVNHVDQTDGDEHLVPQKTTTASELQDVLLLERPHPWSKNMISLYLILIPAYLCSTTNGFDSNTFGGLSALPSFEAYFDLAMGNTQGLLAMLYIVGNIIGALFAGQVADTFGRRYGMALGAILCIIGAILQGSAQSVNTLIPGRIILGMGALCGGTAAPSYVVEYSHPAYRGVMGGMYQTLFFSGTILTTFLEYGFSYVPNSPNWTWRVCMSLQGAPSVITLALVWFIPESPRWYIAHGDQGKARELLVKYHGNGDPNSRIVDLEMRQMIEAIDVNGADKRWYDWRSLFKTRADRYRMLVISMVSVFSELDLPPTSYYLPIMVEAAGVTNTHTVLLLNALQTPIMLCFALTGLNIIERWGRRPSLMVSSTGMTISVAMITAMTAVTPTHQHAGIVGILFLYVFLAIFAFFWTPLQALYPVEVLTFANRAKGFAYYGFLNNAIKIFNTYVPPLAIKKAGWRFYILYIIVDAIGIVCIYFFFPETKGRNLEEVEEIFEAKNPVKHSLMKRKADLVVGAENELQVRHES